MSNDNKVTLVDLAYVFPNVYKRNKKFELPYPLSKAGNSTNIRTIAKEVCHNFFSWKWGTEKEKYS